MNPNRTTLGASASYSVTLLLALAATAAAQDAPRDSARPTTLADAFQRALAQMRADKAPGLVFVLPPTGAPADPEVLADIEKELARAAFGGKPPVTLETRRDVLLWRLQQLRAARSGEVAALLVLTVPIVAEPSACGAKPGETLVLLSAEGERVAGFDVDLADHAAVVDAITPHVLAREAVEPRRANVPPAIARLVARSEELLRLARQRQQEGGLDQEQQQELHTIQQELARRMTAAAPALVESTGERVSFGPNTNWYLLNLYQDTPLGTEVGEQWDPCPPCGMMAGPLAMRSTLKLLAK